MGVAEANTALQAPSTSDSVEALLDVTKLKSNKLSSYVCFII